MKNRQPPKKQSPTYIETGISVGGDAYFKKTLYAHESAKFGGHLEACGNTRLQHTEIEKDAVIHGDTEVVGKFNVSGLSVFDSPVNVRSTLKTKFLVTDEFALFNGEIQIKDKLLAADIYGKNIELSNLHTRENARIDGRIDAHYLELTSNANIKGSVYIAKSIASGGNANIDGALYVKHLASFDEDIYLRKDLKIGGKAHIHSHVYAKGSVFAGGNIQVDGNAIIQNELHANAMAAESIAVNQIDADEILLSGSLMADGNIRAANILCDGGMVCQTIEATNSIEAQSIMAKMAKVEEKFATHNLEADSASINGDVDVTGTISSNRVRCDTLNLAIGEVTAGTYTPDLTSTNNVNYYQPYDCQYMRIGNMVTVSGRIDIEPQREGNAHIQLSLPFPTKIGALHHLSGNAASQYGKVQASCFGDMITNRCQLSYYAITTDRVAFFLQFMYRIEQ